MQESEGQRRVHLVRHGQSEWNSRGLLQGQTLGVGLTGVGRRQAHHVADQLAGFTIGRIVSSDQLRAWETAQIIGSRLGLDPWPSPALREQGLGDWEGRRADELGTSSPGQLDSERRWGGGENVQDVLDRVGALLERLLRTPERGDLVLVTHGDTLRIALAWLSGLGPDEVDWSEVPNGSVTTVCVAGR